MLLKTLEPRPEPVLGDLYLEVHREKWETYLVLDVNREAWPKGVGYLRAGLDAGMIARYRKSHGAKAETALKNALLDKIKIVETDDCNAGYPVGIPNNLIIKTGDGRTVSKRVDFPRGHARNPMTDDEVIAKFRGLATGVVSDTTADRLVNLAMSLDEMSDLSELLAFETL